MEAELKVKYPDSKIELIRGGGGVFDVKCDGMLIYSKHNAESRRFPQEGEIAELIKGKVG